MTEGQVLGVGTEVSAKYRGAFCEATIKHVKESIKVRVVWCKPLTGSATFPTDQIRGEIKLQGEVEAKNSSENGTWCKGTIVKITDASTYTVVFDDGDERTLGRNSVCPQGAKHFNEEWTLDHLPLTNPENFGTPVILDKGKQRKRRKVDSPSTGRYPHYSVEDIGKVAFYDPHVKKQTLQPVLISTPSECQEFITSNPGEVIVRSFRSGKFMSIPKEDMIRFDRDTEPLISIINGSSDISVAKPALEKALAFYDTGILPISWDSTSCSDTPIKTKEPDSINDTKLRKMFTSALHTYWDRKGSAIVRPPSVGYHDLDLYDLYCYVVEYGGPDSVTRNMKWRSICTQMNILNLPPSGSHMVKTAYYRYVVPFAEEWENKTKRRSSPQMESTPLSTKRKPTRAPSQRRNSIKTEETDSVSGESTDYDNMPHIHKYHLGQHVKAIYGMPKQCGSYEAKIIDKNVDAKTETPIYYIHYMGWNSRYDEWVSEDHILCTITRSSKKKGTQFEPSKDMKNVPHRRKVVPKYKKIKKKVSTASETSSIDDKTSLPASETSDIEAMNDDKQPPESGTSTDDKEGVKPKSEVAEVVEEVVMKEEEDEEEELKKIEVPEMRTTTITATSESGIKVEEAPSTQSKNFVKKEVVKIEALDKDNNVSKSQVLERPVKVTTTHRTKIPKHTSEVRLERDDEVTTTQDKKSPLLCDESFDDLITSSTVSSSSGPNKTKSDSELERAKQEAAAVLMTFPSAIKGTLPTHSLLPHGYACVYQPNLKTKLCPTSPSKLPTVSYGNPTQYHSTSSARPIVTAASTAKIPLGGPSPHRHYNRIITKGMMLIPSNDVIQNNFVSTMKVEDNDKKRGRKRKIQQADSTSDIGSRLQQFEFRPDPCDGCDRRTDDRPKRTERDKARRGTVKNSDSKMTTPGVSDRGIIPGVQAAYWSGRSNLSASTLMCASSDMIQGGYYVPMRPPGIGPYPPGYTPKFRLTTASFNAKSCSDYKGELSAASPRTSEVTSTTTIAIEPDSTVADTPPYSVKDVDTPLSKQGGAYRPYYSTPGPSSSSSLITPPHLTDYKFNKSTPTMDSDSSDEKTTVTGASPSVNPVQSASECSDREQPEPSSKVQIFDKNFGIHLFENLELPRRIKEIQSVMSDLQKMYQFYKGEINSIDKKERERRNRKRRKEKQRKTSISKARDSPSKHVTASPETNTATPAATATAAPPATTATAAAAATPPQTQETEDKK